MCSVKSCWSEPWLLSASASCLFFLTAPSSSFVSAFLLFPNVASSLVLLFFFFSDYLPLSWFPKKIKVTVCCQQDLLLWAFRSSEESVHSWSGQSSPAPSVSPTTNQLSLTWQAVSQHSHNEQWLNTFLYPHCSLWSQALFLCSF